MMKYENEKIVDQLRRTDEKQKLSDRGNNRKTKATIKDLKLKMERRKKSKIQDLERKRS